MVRVLLMATNRLLIQNALKKQPIEITPRIVRLIYPKGFPSTPNSQKKPTNQSNNQRFLLVSRESWVVLMSDLCAISASSPLLVHTCHLGQSFCRA